MCDKKVKVNLFVKKIKLKVWLFEKEIETKTKCIIRKKKKKCLYPNGLLKCESSGA